MKKSQSSSDDPETMFGKILDRIGAIDNKLENLGDKVSRIEQSFKEYTQKFHNLEGDVRQIEHSLNTYTDKTDKLQAIADKLAKSTPEVLNKLLDIEHLDAAKKLEVQGIPHDSSEQPMLILNKLSNILQANISPMNIDFVYRNKKGNLIVKFIHTHARDQFFQCFKKREGPLSAKDIGYSRSDARIYVNEFLTYATRDLFWRTRQFKTANRYKYAWVAGQQVYLKKSEHDTAIKINSLADLEEHKSQQ